jgi:hypothetical protein
MSKIFSGQWLAAWTAAKRNFEANTGRKKPSPKVLGVFKQDV